MLDTDGSSGSTPDVPTTTAVRSRSRTLVIYPLQERNATGARMPVRHRLPNRRTSTTFNFKCGRHDYTATISYFPGTDQLAEIFLGNGRAGSDVDASSKDSAILASLCLQHSVPVETIRKALLRDPRGVAASPLGVALDAISNSVVGP